MAMISFTDRFRIHVNKDTNLKLGWTKYNDWYETIYPSLDLISLCLLTGAECGKGIGNWQLILSVAVFPPGHHPTNPYSALAKMTGVV